MTGSRRAHVMCLQHGMCFCGGACACGTSVRRSGVGACHVWRCHVWTRFPRSQPRLQKVYLRTQCDPEFAVHKCKCAYCTYQGIYILIYIYIYVFFFLREVVREHVMCVRMCLNSFRTSSYFTALSGDRWSKAFQSRGCGSALKLQCCVAACFCLHTMQCGDI